MQQDHRSDTFDQKESRTNGDSNTTPPSHETFPVLIVGGGAVGCLVALKLARAGIKVEIIEKSPAVSTSPRAVGYYGIVQHVLNEIGVYQIVRDAGFMTRGLCWRALPEDDGQGGKRLGRMVAAQPLCAPDDYAYPIGAGLLGLVQADLNRLLLQEACATGLVRIKFNVELVSILENKPEGVRIQVRDVTTGREREMNANYLIGADGAHSAVRKALGLSFPGHTWPEKLVASNVLIKNIEKVEYHTHYVFHPVHYGVSTPLEPPEMGKKTLWRYAIASNPEENLTDEELASDENLLKLYEQNMAGPRPLDVEIKQRTVYRIHQRLAPTMRSGNCALAGDAAHLNNPMGALGLNNGLLDADALAESFIMILKEHVSSEILDLYSDERRKVFQYFVDPESTHNKLRVQSNDPDSALQNDWYIRMMSNPTLPQLMEMEKKYTVDWRTNMRELWAKKSAEPKLYNGA